MYNRKDDSQLIWESLVTRTKHKQNNEFQQLLENDIEYIERFLIAEGLMDKVKGAYQGAKEFASSKILKPIMAFLAQIIANDPQTAEKAQAAAKKGPEALHQLASAEGDQGIVQQLQSGAMGESVLSYQFTLNEMICEALLEDGIITSKHSQIIQEKHFQNTINVLHEQVIKEDDCPWQPVVIERSLPPVGNPSRKPRNNYDDITAKINKLIAMSPKNTERDIFSKLMKTNVKFANFVKRQASAAANQQQNEPDAPEQPDSSQQQEQPTSQTQQPPTQSTAPTPNLPSSGKTGLLGKIWNFIKSNKGAISGAAALGIAAALTATGNPMASAYLTGALIGGVRGAIKGATSTEGGFVDKLKGAANQAGKDSMIGGGIAAAGAGMAGAVGDLALGGTDIAGGTGDAAAAEVSPGGDEFSEPTRPDAAELDQMKADTGTLDPEANANGDLPDAYDPANSANPDVQNPEADANANLPNPYDQANSQAPSDGTSRGINPDGSEYTKDADGNVIDGQQATNKKSFGQKFKDFFKPAQTQPGEPSTFQKMRMRR